MAIVYREQTVHRSRVPILLFDMSDAKKKRISAYKFDRDEFAIAVIVECWIYLYGIIVELYP